MALDRVFGTGLLAIAFLQHLILQTTGEGNDAIFLGILSQILLASLLSHLAGFLALLVDFLFLSGEELLHNHLSLATLYFQFLATKNILDSLCKIVDIQFLTTHVCQLVTNANT